VRARFVRIRDSGLGAALGGGKDGFGLDAFAVLPYAGYCPAPPRRAMPDPSKSRTTLPCPVCGKAEFIDGTVRAQGMRFLADATSGWKKAFAFGTGMRARMCAGCQHVQLFATGAA